MFQIKCYILLFCTSVQLLLALFFSLSLGCHSQPFSFQSHWSAPFLLHKFDVISRCFVFFSFVSSVCCFFVTFRLFCFMIRFLPFYRLVCFSPFSPYSVIHSLHAHMNGCYEETCFLCCLLVTKYHLQMLENVNTFKFQEIFL